MPTVLQFRGFTTAVSNLFTGQVKEITVDTDKDVPVVHDGVTPGGHPVAARANADGSISLITKAGGVPASFSPAGNLLVGGAEELGHKLNVGVVPLAGGQSGHARFGTTVGGNPYGVRVGVSIDGPGAASAEIIGPTESADRAGVVTKIGPTSREGSRLSNAGYYKVTSNGMYPIFGEAARINQFSSDENIATLSVTNTNEGAGVVTYRSDLFSANPTGRHYVAINNNAATVFQILANGDAQNTNNVYGAISDAKLKENVDESGPKLEKLNQLRVVNYNLIGDDLRQIGLIAQEVEQIFPGLVVTTPDTVEVEKTRAVDRLRPVLDAEGKPVIAPDGKPAMQSYTETQTYTERVPNGEFTKSIKYSVLVPMLLKGLQELAARVQVLESAP